jgi:hypothetical protein
MPSTESSLSVASRTEKGAIMARSMVGQKNRTPDLTPMFVRQTPVMNIASSKSKPDLVDVSSRMRREKPMV